MFYCMCIVVVLCMKTVFFCFCFDLFTSWVNSPSDNVIEANYSYPHTLQFLKLFFPLSNLKLSPQALCKYLAYSLCFPGSVPRMESVLCTLLLRRAQDPAATCSGRAQALVDLCYSFTFTDKRSAVLWMSIHPFLILPACSSPGSWSLGGRLGALVWSPSLGRHKNRQDKESLTVTLIDILELPEIF